MIEQKTRDAEIGLHERRGATPIGRPLRWTHLFILAGSRDLPDSPVGISRILSRRSRRKLARYTDAPIPPDRHARLGAIRERLIVGEVWRESRTFGYVQR